jgi:hypothetical protein
MAHYATGVLSLGCTHCTAGHTRLGWPAVPALRRCQIRRDHCKSRTPDHRADKCAAFCLGGCPTSTLAHTSHSHSPSPPRSTLTLGPATIFTLTSTHTSTLTHTLIHSTSSPPLPIGADAPACEHAKGSVVGVQERRRVSLSDIAPHCVCCLSLHWPHTHLHTLPYTLLHHTAPSCQLPPLLLSPYISALPRTVVHITTAPGCSAPECAMINVFACTICGCGAVV